MTLYLVRHETGPACLVDADSPQQAQTRSPNRVAPVLSVRPHWREWLRLRTVPASEQRLLLAQMSVRLSRGGASGEDYERVIEQLPALKRNRDRTRVPSLIDLAPHEILLHLNVHPFLVVLCREGERMGTVPALLVRAIEFLDVQERIGNELRGPLLRSLLYTAAALGLLGVMPFLFESVLAGLSDRIVVHTNAATNILLAIHQGLTTYVWLTIGVVCALVALSVQFWEQLRKLPVVCDADGLVRARRSYMLLAALAPTFRKGINLAELVGSLRSLLGTRASDYLSARLQAGHLLSDSLPERYFLRSLYTGLDRFEDTPEQNLADLFTAIQMNLAAELRWYTARIVRAARWFYMMLIMALMVLMLQGFLLPIYSVSVR